MAVTPRRIVVKGPLAFSSVIMANNGLEAVAIEMAPIIRAMGRYVPNRLYSEPWRPPKNGIAESRNRTVKRKTHPAWKRLIHKMLLPTRLSRSMARLPPME